MLKKIIATAMCFAWLVTNSSMIASAEDFNAETSVTTEMEETFVSETAIASKTTSFEETTATESSSAAEVGKTIRESLDVSVKDIVIFDDVVNLYDAEGNSYFVDFRWRIWIVGIDDANQRFRVHSPDVTPNNECVTYLKYEDAKRAVPVSHEGRVIGDLNNDGLVNVFDMCYMRRGFTDGWNQNSQKQLADMNADNDVTIADLVWMQQWLLGAIK